MLMENSNIEIIGGGLFFTEIEIQNDNEKFVPSESDKEAIRKNIEEIECLKIQSPQVQEVKVLYWNKNKKKYIVIIFGGILILVILCLGDYGIRYYNAPIEKDYKYIGTGMLVHLSDFTNGELVSVEMRRKTAYYIWGNQEDYIQGNVWLNGEKIFGKDDMEIVGLFINAEPYY